MNYSIKKKRINRHAHTQLDGREEKNSSTRVGHGRPKEEKPCGKIEVEGLLMSIGQKIEQLTNSLDDIGQALRNISG